MSEIEELQWEKDDEKEWPTRKFIAKRKKGRR